MKKFMLMAAAATLMLSLVACTGETNNAKNPNLTEDTVQTTNQETASIETYMGQVSRKVGNDLTLSLGKFVLDNAGGNIEGIMIDENGNQRPYEGDMNDDGEGVMVMIPMPDDGSEQGDEGTTGDSPIEKLPIEFTGEVRDFTIPAGVKIVNALGKEVTLDAVTKGSLVQLVVNETTGAVESLMVW